MQFLKLLPFFGVILAPAAPVLAADGDYVSAFGSEYPDLHPGIDVQPEAAPASDDALTALRQLGSFPVRVRLGDASDQAWPVDERRDYVPKPVGRHYKVGACEFVIRTGDFTVRTYEEKDDESLVIKSDPVLRHSTLVVEESTLLSVSADIYASAVPGKKKACHDKFAGHRIKFGKASMAQTSLTLQTDSHKEIKPELYSETDDTAVYLVWDEVIGNLAVVDAAGVPPAVESGIYAANPKSAGDYYLTVVPKLEIARTPKKS